LIKLTQSSPPFYWGSFIIFSFPCQIKGFGLYLIYICISQFLGTPERINSLRSVFLLAQQSKLKFKRKDEKIEYNLSFTKTITFRTP
jgi:predicted tellurium resistance membrane protein TerC